MSSQWPVRLAVARKAAARALLHRPRRRAPPAEPRDILVVATLLIGDGLLLAPLLAKLHHRFPNAAIRVTVGAPVVPLFAGRPYGAQAAAFNPRDGRTLAALQAWPAPDLAFVPGDNRYSWLAAALGARWIVAFEGDRPAYKSWPVDETVAFPREPAAWHDIAAALVPGAPPPPYRAGDWPAVPCTPFDRPQGRYAVLHVEASHPSKHWAPGKWRELATLLADVGIQPVWSAGPKGEPLIRSIDSQGAFAALGHRLDLAQLWNLVADASLLVCPDTGVSHMGKLTGTPTVTLYGPRSATLFGRGEFFRDAPFRELVDADIPARAQQGLFKRRLEWLAVEPHAAPVLGARDVFEAGRTLPWR
ncbi:MAG TPA: glycosyltransferase family 9 protein [Burkholderiales bacterium]|nr:glycosyltransferase family 9 protein [Burkholderiales bacterium]